MWRSSGTNAERHPGSDLRLSPGRQPFEDIGGTLFGRATDKFVQTRWHRLVEPVARPLRQLTLAILRVSVRSQCRPSNRCLVGRNGDCHMATVRYKPWTGLLTNRTSAGVHLFSFAGVTLLRVVAIVLAAHLGRPLADTFLFL